MAKFQVRIVIDTTTDPPALRYEARRGALGPWGPGEPLEVKPNDTIQWTSNDGELAIHFPVDSPFDSGERLLTARRRDWTKSGRKARSIDPGKRVFKYEVAVQLKNGMADDDPHVIIDNSVKLLAVDLAAKASAVAPRAKARTKK